jgi:hypothetical protein
MQLHCLDGTILEPRGKFVKKLSYEFRNNMPIASHERVIYDNNPLAEVICQLRFDRLSPSWESLDSSLVETFAHLGFTHLSQDDPFSIQVVTQSQSAPASPPYATTPHEEHTERDLANICKNS